MQCNAGKVRNEHRKIRSKRKERKKVAYATKAAVVADVATKNAR